MRRLSAPQLAAHLAEHSPLLLDVREPWEFQLCHIEGSRLLPLGEVAAATPQLPADEEIVVICHHGNRSMRVCEYLEQRGFTRLINLDGGVDAWAKLVDTSLATY